MDLNYILEFSVPFLGHERCAQNQGLRLNSQIHEIQKDPKISSNFMVDTGQGSTKCTLCGKSFTKNHMHDYLIAKHLCPNRY